MLNSGICDKCQSAHRARVRGELEAFVRHLVHEAEQNGDRPGPKMIGPDEVESIDIDAFMDRDQTAGKEG